MPPFVREGFEEQLQSYSTGDVGYFEALPVSQVVEAKAPFSTAEPFDLPVDPKEELNFSVRVEVVV